MAKGMALLRFELWIFALLAALPASLSLSGPHIADVNILLPPKMTNPVEYRLQGSDGCFQWSWDHHDILSVLPEYNLSSHCSTSARLRSIAPYSGRKETAIYATDVRTGFLVRCKVFIDDIKRIQIFHSSVKLDLDGLATLRVRAFDSEDNVFSSLVGLQFMWQLMPETDGLPHHLVHVPLKDSPLSDCGGLCGDLNVQIKIEESGVFSDLYVVQGVEVGHQIVFVQLLEPQYEHMEDRILLTVAEAMSVDPPSPVFVLIDTVVQFGLTVIRGNLPQVVMLPSPHYRWSVLNSSVAEADSVLGIVHALDLGVSTVTVEDTRVAGHLQMSSLHVVVPDNICLYILPLSPSGDLVEGTSATPSAARWYIISGQQYVIYMKVFSRGPGAREIYLPENDDVRLHYLSEYWKTFLVSDSLVVKHGWRNSRILKATSHGLGKLTASLTYSTGHPTTKEVLKVVQEVMVCEQVKLSMGSDFQSIVLPWAPGVYQEVELMAIGGCAKAVGDYKWFSSDTSTVSVSTTGVVQAKKPGKATVKVVSIFDSFNYDEVLIEISIPSSMAMLQSLPVETVVGSHLPVAVTLKASNGASFYKCDAFNSFIRWKVGGETFIIANATGESSFLGNLGNVKPDVQDHGPPCAWTYLYASVSGQALVHATLSKDHQQYGSTVLKISSRIAAYAPLRVSQAGDGNQFGGYWFDMGEEEAHNYLGNLVNLHLVPGSQMDIMLLGGPERWDRAVEYVETAYVLDDKHDLEGADLLHQASISRRNLYRIYCHMLGSYRLVFKRGNLVGDDHPIPSIAETEMFLMCSLPSSIVLLADEPVNAPDVIQSAIQAERGPGRVRTSPITVANGRRVRISAVGISNSGKAFGNSSSLCLNWDLSSCDGLAYWDDAYNCERSQSIWERFLVLQDGSGLCIIRATVTGFHDYMADRSFTPSFQSLEDVLVDTVRLQLVSTLRVEPEFNLVFLSPDAKVNLSIRGGSCFLDPVINDSRVVEIIQPSPGLQCSQLILAPKGLGTAVVTVYDIGLAPPLAASSLVEVADVDWIKVNSGQEISIMEGSLHSFNLLAGVRDGRTFDPSQFAHMNLFLHIKDGIIDLVDDGDISVPRGGYINSPNFVIMAKDLGVTTIYVSARQHSGLEIFSQPIKVEVYIPPRIHPENILLAPGASYVITVKGGPTFGACVEYAIPDDGTARVHKSSGRLSAISPGNTTLVATIFGNGDLMMCQAYASVEVLVPSSVKLSTQSDQLAVGCKMPIYPSLPQGDLFSFYELCKDYKWKIEDEKVLSFHSVKLLDGDKYGAQTRQNEFTLASYMNEKELGFINVLYGRSAGKTDVAVSFTCNFISSGSFSEKRSYNASVSLLVVPDLPLALGSPITWILPPYYTSSSLLPSSTEFFLQSDAQGRGGTITYSLLRDCLGNGEEINEAVIAIDGDKVKTAESGNIACIKAKNSITGRIDVAACVKVAEVSQVRGTSKEYPWHAINLAVGAEVQLPINYCDILGYPFREAYDGTMLYAETNYPDIVLINGTQDGNGNIKIKGVGHGTALLRISIHGSLQKSDYMLMSVGARLYPQNPILHLGSSLNFSIDGLNDKVSGWWASSNQSVARIDEQSGKAKAVGEGNTQVTFKGSSLALQTTVTVLVGSMLSVDAPQEALTNAPPIRGYNFLVKFSNPIDKKSIASGNSEDVQYNCRVEPPFIGYTRPWRDLDSGNAYCLFFPYPPEHLMLSLPKSKDVKPDIHVSVNASLREANHVSASASASALFIGGFSILEMDKDFLQLNFTPECNSSLITIVGNTDIEIHWQNRDLLMISPVHREGFGIAGHAQFEVKVQGGKKFVDRVVFRLPANGQRVEVDVNYEPGERDPSASSARMTLWLGILGCFALFVFTVAVFMWFLDRPERTQSTIFPATPNSPSPNTPTHGSPSVLSEQSPRTPPPFVDYIRRTLDETPHYRRDGRRRRYGPQHTF